MHFAKIPDEPVESTHTYRLTTSSVKALGRESSSAASSEDCSSEDSEDERVQHLAKLQEQVVFLWSRTDARRFAAAVFKSLAVYNFSYFLVHLPFLIFPTKIPICYSILELLRFPSSLKLSRLPWLVMNFWSFCLHLKCWNCWCVPWCLGIFYNSIYIPSLSDWFLLKCIIAQCGIFYKWDHLLLSMIKLTMFWDPMKRKSN